MHARYMAVTRQVHGFIEMQTMKVGALLDTPEAARVKMLEKERAKAREKQARAGRDAEKRAKEAELLTKLRTADQLAYEARLPLVKQARCPHPPREAVSHAPTRPQHRTRRAKCLGAPACRGRPRVKAAGEGRG